LDLEIAFEKLPISKKEVSLKIFMKWTNLKVISEFGMAFGFTYFKSIFLKKIISE